MKGEDLKAELVRVAGERLPLHLCTQFVAHLETPVGQLTLARAQAGLPVWVDHGIAIGHPGALEFFRQWLVDVIDWYTKNHARHIAASPAQDLRTAPAKTGPVTAKKTLLDECRAQWPSIDSDLKHANENGLASAARNSTGRGWFKDCALHWARENGKLRGPFANTMANAPVSHKNSPW